WNKSSQSTIAGTVPAGRLPPRRRPATKSPLSSRPQFALFEVTVRLPEILTIRQGRVTSPSRSLPIRFSVRFSEELDHQPVQRITRDPLRNVLAPRMRISLDSQTR